MTLATASAYLPLSTKSTNYWRLMYYCPKTSFGWMSSKYCSACRIIKGLMLGQYGLSKRGEIGSTLLQITPNVGNTLLIYSITCEIFIRMFVFKTVNNKIGTHMQYLWAINFFHSIKVTLTVRLQLLSFTEYFESIQSLKTVLRMS